MKQGFLPVTGALLVLLLLAQGVTCPGAFSQSVKYKIVPPRPSDRFGAIAYSASSGAWGTSYDYQTRAEAEQRALSRCAQGDCQVRVWFRNACGALAVGRGNCMGWGWASDKDEAQRKALNNCRQYGTGCSVKCWACTSSR
jgi:serine/threonine-protein kinase